MFVLWSTIIDWMAIVKVKIFLKKIVHWDTSGNGDLSVTFDDRFTAVGL